MRSSFRTTVALAILVLGFMMQASLAGLLEWRGTILHFFPALFFFLLPTFPRMAALAVTVVCGILYDGLWGVYPGVYLASYITGMLAVRLLARNLDVSRLPARFVTALSGLIIYTIVAGAAFLWLKKSSSILHYIGWEAGMQTVLILLFTLIVSIYHRIKHKPVIYG